MKIMIADDDEAIVDSVKLILELEGYEVMYTYNGEDVLHLKNDLPKLLLLDIWMSGVDGTEICKKMKENEQLKNIPVIMMSASRDVKSSAASCGADDYLEKPFDINDLIDKIKILINN